jgi:hypothetical protein
VAGDGQLSCGQCHVMSRGGQQPWREDIVGWGGDAGAPGSLDVPRWKIHRVIIHMKEMEGFKFIVWGGRRRRWREKRTSSRTSDGLVGEKEKVSCLVSTALQVTEECDRLPFLVILFGT